MKLLPSLSLLASLALYLPGAVAQDTRYVLCSSIHGAHIRCTDSDDVGTIHDVLIDPSEGRIVTIITSVNDRLIPVPWTCVQAGDTGGVYTIQTTREELVAAPTIEDSQITTFSPDLYQRSDTFFREKGSHRSTVTNVDEHNNAAGIDGGSQRDLERANQRQGAEARAAGSGSERDIERMSQRGDSEARTSDLSERGRNGRNSDGNANTLSSKNATGSHKRHSNGTESAADGNGARARDRGEESTIGSKDMEKNGTENTIGGGASASEDAGAKANDEERSKASANQGASLHSRNNASDAAEGIETKSAKSHQDRSGEGSAASLRSSHEKSTGEPTSSSESAGTKDKEPQ